jgi:hypothetical protein
MNAPDDALFQALQQRFPQGTTHVSAEEQQHRAGRLFDLLLATGGPRATGGLTVLPDGIFWPIHMAERSRASGINRSGPGRFRWSV